MSVEAYKTEMIQLFKINEKNFFIGNKEKLLNEINKGVLNLSSFENMFELMIINREFIREGDYRQMYDLYYRIEKCEFLHQNRMKRINL